MGCGELAGACLDAGKMDAGTEDHVSESGSRALQDRFTVGVVFAEGVGDRWDQPSGRRGMDRWCLWNGRVASMAP
jgi:hypothetical protein